MHKYLIVVDMQNDFVGGALGSPQAEAIVPTVAGLIEDARREGRTVIFTQDTHDAGYMDTGEGRHLPVPHCVKGTDGWQIDARLLPYATEAIEKPTFGSTALVRRLQADAGEGGQDLDILLCGVCTDICVVSNALLLRAHFPEATIRLAPSACAGTSAGRHDAAIAVMQSCHIDMA